MPKNSLHFNDKYYYFVRIKLDNKRNDIKTTNIT